MLKRITARHFDLSEEMKIQAEQEIDSLTRYFENIVSADLILDMERHRRKAELKINVYNNTLTGTGDTDDMYNSISVAVEKVKSQLKKYKGKLKDKRPEEISGVKDELTRPSTDLDEIDI